MVARLRAAGWSGPYAGGRHPTMINGQHSLTIPNPHRGDIDWSLMKRVLRQAGLTPEAWERLGKHD